MKRAITIILLSLLAFVVIKAPAALASTQDPTQSVNRVRVVMTTTSDWSHLYFPTGESMINFVGSQTSGSAGIATVNSTDVFIAQNRLGRPSTVQFDILLTTDGVTGGLWQITKGWGQQTHVDIYNINDMANPVLIASKDDVAADGTPKTFTITAADESRGGPLASGDTGPRRVFAFYAPWWHYDSWNDPTKSDRPTTPYSVSSVTDVKRLVDSAAGAGIEGFISSYQGYAYNDQTFRTLLDAAAQNGNFTVSSYVETAVANSAHSESAPTDPVYMRQWISEIVQNYASSPNYLHYNGKPVIFIYRARTFSPDTWKTQVFDPLRAQGIDAFFMADFMGGDNGYPVADYLNVFDGMHSYNPSVYLGGIASQLSANSIATKTYSMLNNPGAPRKLWMGTVVPGFDDTLIRSPGTLISRDNGNFYDTIWNANLITNPDWVMVTTWNDYGENTQIEESRNYGSQYLDMTRTYASAYRSGSSGGGTLSISNVTSQAFLPAGFEVTWQTSADSNSVLMYGTSPGVYTGQTRTTGSTGSHRLTVTGLQPGRYYAKVRSTALDGSSGSSDEFQVVIPNESVPSLSISEGQTYWLDYASYLERNVTVDIVVKNSGRTAVNGLEVSHIDSTAGTVLKSALPLGPVDVPSGATRTIRVQWGVPSMVTNFQVFLWARGTTAQGTTVYYPGPAPE